MHIGVDFDNTIVCYDALFHRVARERDLIPADLPVNKSDVRNHLRRIGKEDVWTEMQGYVYGGRMAEADAYPGALDFFNACRQAGIKVSIISHKTRYPFLGTKYDLHQAALNWLEQQGFFDENRIGLPRENAFFELTKQAKLERIGLCGCTHFIDDLPEFLAEAAFPQGVDRLLFDPNDLYGEEKQFRRMLSWIKILDFFTSTSKATSEELTPAIASFLEAHKLTSPRIQRLNGGGNNRVYRVESATGEAVLKSYFQTAADKRDRFGAERAFYSFVWTQGVRRTPEPLGWDAENRLGLFTLIGGNKIQTVTQSAVEQAIDFVVETNHNKAQATGIAAASEACFSVSEHLQTIDRRVARLLEIEAQSPIDHQARTFICDHLHPAWNNIRKSLVQRAESTGSLSHPLSNAHWCLSPSDFGFHNALIPADGQLRFLDFEYAGWDDPAKLVCDFFCQPQIPVSLEFWDLFIQKLRSNLEVDTAFPERARLLLPAYQIKWCCIMLNEFVRMDSARRDFAKGAATASDRKAEQLAKAQRALETALQTWRPAC